MDRFDDVSVVASVDESPPPPRVPRGARRAFTAAVASVVVAGALAGAAVGLASEKAEPAKPPTPVNGANEGWSSYAPLGHHKCHRGMRHQQSSDSSALNY
ncbi:MAG: hypothetical protein ABI611_04610 [Solirubrobacteraceae bacterium]